MGVANVRRVGANGAVATAATNLHFFGNSASGVCAVSGAECTDDTACTGPADFCIRNFAARCKTDPDQTCSEDADCPAACVSGTCQDATPNACTSSLQCDDALAGSGICAAPTIRLPLAF